MNVKERVTHAFLHKEADTVPIGDPVIDSHVANEVLKRETWVGQGGFVKKKRDMMMHQGMRDEFVDKYKNDTVDFFKKIDVDFMISELMPPINISTRLECVDENRWRIINDEAHIWHEYAYEDEADIVMEMDSSFKVDDDYKTVSRYLDYFESNYLGKPDSGMFDALRFAKEKLGNEKFISIHLVPLFPSGTSWYTQFLEMFYLAPDISRRLFDLYLKRALIFLEEYGRIGIDALYVAGDWAANSGPLFSPELVREYFIPQIRVVTELAHSLGIFVIKHTDGNVMKIADDFFSMGIDAYQSVEPHAGMNLKVVKERYGDKITFMGNVDCGRTLITGTKDEIVGEVKQCLLDGAAGGGYVLTSSNTITKMVPAENFFIMLEAARKYGKYPINL